MTRDLTTEISQQINEYLSGARQKFTGSAVVKIEQLPGTDFQRAVWRAISQIPYGETRSYQWVAQKIGKNGASRAVGTACGKNPLPILIPCHRVIQANGQLGNYSGGGIEMKEFLIALEKNFAAAN